jgi:hypothetical protein
MWYLKGTFIEFESLRTKTLEKGREAQINFTTTNLNEVGKRRTGLSDCGFSQYLCKVEKSLLSAVEGTWD